MSDFNGNNYIPPEPTIPTIDNPEFEVPPQPAQFEQPMYFQQPVNLTNGMPPKKSKKKLVAILSTVIGVAACACVAIFAGPKIIDALSNSSKEAPMDRLKSSFESLSKELSESETNTETTVLKNFNTKLNMNLSLSDNVVSMLSPTAVGLKDTTIVLDATNYENQGYFNLNLSTPTAKAVSLNGYVNLDDSNLYLQIPELSESYFSAPIELTGTLNEVPQTPQVSGKELAKLLDDEVNTFFNATEEVKIEEDVTVQVNGVSAEYDKITVSMNGTEFGNTIYTCYERLTQENFVKEFITAYSASSDLSIDETLAEIKKWADTNTTGATFEFYLNDDDEIKGLVILPESTGSTRKICFMTATDDSTAFEFYASENDVKLFLVDGTSEKNKDAYSGNVKITTYENGIAGNTIELQFNDVKSDKDSFKGSFTLAGSALSGFSITLDADTKQTEGNLTLSVDMASMNMGTLSIDFAKTDVTSCPTLPADAVVFDSETQQEEFMATADIMGFMTNFYNATGIDLTTLLGDDTLY